jgi:hypothetical protein
MINLWIDKYSPHKCTQIIGNKNNISILKNFLNNFNEFKYKSLIISGKRGIGKTLAIKILLKELEYDHRLIYPDEIKNYRSDNDFKDYYNFNNSVNVKMNFTKKKKLALIFDDAEGITLSSEKKYIINIFKENNKQKSFPLIFISNNQHNKLMNDLKKNNNEIKFEIPTLEEFTEYIKFIFTSENIKWSENFNFELLLKFADFDFRRLLNILYDLSLNFNLVDNNIITEYIKNSIEKTNNTGLFESTLKLINNYDNYNNILKLYEIEKVLLPLMIHENYIFKFKKNNNNNLEDLINITDSLSRGDNIETNIYTNQNWFLQDLHAFFTCIKPSYLLNRNETDKDLNLDDIKFSSDLNKTSLKNINKKNINNLLKIFQNKDIDEILYLNKICNYYISNEMDDELINILSSYNKNIDIKELELCLKIDKTCLFNKLTNKCKKKISNKLIN